MRIAIVGSGVTGLVAARELHDEHEITVLEQHDYLGGHARTVVVPEPDRSVAVDVGFIVFNRRNYPRFSSLLDELGVASQPSEMSFGVSCRRCRIDYSSRGMRGLLARPTQACRPRIYRMAADIVRFNRWASQQPTGALEAWTIGDLRREGRFGADLFNHYLLPMTGAIWSSTGIDVDAMPLEFLVSFYRNHGLLQIQGHPQWRTVTGGSARYVDALTRPYRARVRLRTPVRTIRRRAGHVDVRTDDGWERFDQVCSPRTPTRPWRFCRTRPTKNATSSRRSRIARTRRCSTRTTESSRAHRRLGRLGIAISTIARRTIPR